MLMTMWTYTRILHFPKQQQQQQLRCLLCRSSKFSDAVGEETVELPQLQHGHCRCHARRCATTDAGWFRRQKTVKVPQLQYILTWSMSLLCRSSFGFRPFLDKVVDMPVVCNDSGLANSEGASDSVHRRSLWTFQLATEMGTLSAGLWRR